MTNIYLELELFLDPPITDTDALKAELNRKIAEWNKKVVSNPKFSSKVACARKYIADGMPNCRETAAIARSQKLDELRSAIREQSMTGKITDRGFVRLSELFPCFSEATIISESGFVPEQLFRPPTAPPSLQCNRVIPAIEMESIQTDLQVVENGKYTDLYSLLGETPNTPRKTLHAKAEEALEKNRRVAIKSAEVNAKNRLYGKALSYFKDDYGQLDYDAALTRQVFEQICRKKFQHRAINGIVTMAIYKKSVADACEAGLTSAEAEWLVYEYYCVKMKCPPPIQMEDSAATSQSESPNWIRDLKDLVVAWRTKPVRQSPPPPPPPVAAAPVPPENARAIAVEEPTILLETFQVKDIKNTVNPFDDYTLETIVKDKKFWQATMLSVVPIGIVGFVSNAELIILLYYLFGLLCIIGFLYIIGRMYQRYFLRRTERIRVPIIASFLTFGIGLFWLWVLYDCYPPPPWLLFPAIGIVGELIKVTPVAVYLLLFRGKASVKMAFSIGLLSSIGFAGSLILVGTVQSEIIGNLYACSKASFPFAIISLLIVHAIGTAIFTYHFFCAVCAGSRGFPLLFVGWALATLLQIIYMILCYNEQPGLATILVSASFVLFYGYLTQVRRQIIQSP